MKELSIDEKAKRYDEVFEQLRTMMPNWENLSYNGKTFLQDLVHIIPELAESEDEKIRKEIISYIKSSGAITNQEWIAWLEKQGEEKTVVIIPKFRVGDIVKSKSQPMLSPRKIISIGKDCYWCEDRGCIGFAWEDDCELVEQKSAEWSEEDERIYDSIHKDLALTSKQKNWFKSLKDRVGCEVNCTTTKEWSEEDKMQLDAAIHLVTSTGHISTTNWLISLKDRVQSKQEWNKDDEIWIDRACMLLDELNHLSTLTLAKIPSNVNDIISHLKSLKPQNHWKPTEEQLKGLAYAMSAYNGAFTDIIKSLYNDLKKL